MTVRATDLTKGARARVGSAAKKSRILMPIRASAVQAWVRSDGKSVVDERWLMLMQLLLLPGGWMWLLLLLLRLRELLLLLLLLRLRELLLLLLLLLLLRLSEVLLLLLLLLLLRLTSAVWLCRRSTTARALFGWRASSYGCRCFERTEDGVGVVLFETSHNTLVHFCHRLPFLL